MKQTIFRLAGLAACVSVLAGAMVFAGDGVVTGHASAMPQNANSSIAQDKDNPGKGSSRKGHDKNNPDKNYKNQSWNKDKNNAKSNKDHNKGKGKNKTKAKDADVIDNGIQTDQKVAKPNK